MADTTETANNAHAIKFAVHKIQFPFIKELRNYSVAKFRDDAQAGATLTLISIPQAIGLSLILNMPPLPVILSVMVGGVVGAFFFSSRHHVFGPTNSACLIVSSTIAALTAAQSVQEMTPLQLAAYMALLIGVMQFIAGFLNLGEISKFISRSVIIAYSAAIGLTLVASQLGNFLGISENVFGFFPELKCVAVSILSGEIGWFDFAIGAITLLIFLGIHKWRPRWPAGLIGLAFAGVFSLCFALVNARLYNAESVPFRTVRDISEIAAGMPGVTWFSFSAEHLTLLPTLFGSVVAISIIGMLESVSITKTLASKSGQTIETSQELVGMGAGNIACALFGAVPGSSSFMRSTASFQSGAKTQMASIFSSILVLFILLFVTPIFNYIPISALAAQLILLGFKMVSLPQIRIACRSTRSDAAVFFGTLIAAMALGLDVAIYVGIGISLALFLQKTSAPILVEYAFDDNTGELAELADKHKRPNPQIAIIHVEGELFFGAADVFLTQVRRQADDENIRIFILRMKNARHLDASAVMALESLREHLFDSKRHLLISGCTEDALKVLRNSGVIKTIGEENIFPGDPTNPNVSTRRALMRASYLLSGEADIRIFYDRRRSKNDTAAVEQPRFYEI